MNDIICQVEMSEYDCYVAETYVEILMYADDYLLVLTTCGDLRHITAICELETRWLDMQRSDLLDLACVMGRHMRILFCFVKCPL